MKTKSKKYENWNACMIPLWFSAKISNFVNCWAETFLPHGYIFEILRQSQVNANKTIRSIFLPKYRLWNIHTSGQYLNWLQKKAFRILSLCWILRNGLILAIAFNLEFPMRQICLIWGSKDKAESKVTPKIFAVSLFDTTSFLIVMVKLPFLFVISWHLSALPIIWFRGKTRFLNFLELSTQYQLL